MSIDYWRGKIDEIEQELLELINRRAKYAQEIGRIKRQQGLPILNAKREQEIIERICHNNPGPMSNDYLTNIFKVIIENTRNFEAEHTMNSSSDNTDHSSFPSGQ
jgi:chorismate mutase